MCRKIGRRRIYRELFENVLSVKFESGSFRENEKNQNFPPQTFSKAVDKRVKLKETLGKYAGSEGSRQDFK